MSAVPKKNLLALTLFLVVALTSFSVRLGVVTYPRQVVYDEVHFGKHAQAYCCSHEHYFDVHPPLGKILLSLPLMIAGVSGQQDFDRIGNDYTDVSPALFRFLPGLFGSLLPMAVMALALMLGISLWPSFFVGFAVATDNGFIVQSRFALLDMFLLAFLVASLLFYEISRRLATQQAAKGAQTTLFSMSYEWLFLVLAGASAGASTSIKFSGIVSLAMILLSLSASLMKRTHGKCKEAFAALLFRRLYRGAIVVLTALSVYGLSWLAHFRLLTQPGGGDAFYKLTQHFWTDIIAIHPKIFEENAKLASHGDASPWWSWPFMHKPVYYWTHEGADIYFVGNPVLWWGIVAATLWAFIAIMKRRLKQPSLPKKFKVTNEGINKIDIPWYGLVGAAGSLLPFALVSRPFFSYNHLMPLIFLLLFCAQACDRLDVKWTRLRRAALVTLLVVGFISVLPFTYGFQAPAQWQRELLQLVK